MPDREKLMKALTLCANGNPCVSRKYLTCPYSPIGKPEHYRCGAAMAAGVLALLREQEPRVMTVSEVKRIGADNHGSFKDDGPTVMWLEEFGKQFPLHVVILKWDEDDWQGEPNNIVNVYYFGTDEFDRFSLTDYNKAWRCWTDKPTEMQRMGAAWDA